MYVRDGPYANTHFGSDQQLAVKSAAPGGGYVRVSDLKFDLSQVQGQIFGGEFYLSGATQAAATAPVSVGVFPVADSSWTEAGITYANAPSVTGPCGTFQVGGPAVGTYTVDLTNYLNQQRAWGTTRCPSPSKVRPSATPSSRSTAASPLPCIRP